MVSAWLVQGSSTQLVWRNNLVFLNTTNYSGIADQNSDQMGNISVDPLLFTDHWPRPSASSPVLDAGTLSVPNLPSTDFEGKPRESSMEMEMVSVRPGHRRV